MSYYTLNDNVLRDMVETLLLAEETYGGGSYRAAAVKVGDFLLLAQMPEPQPAWAQQYDAGMHPAWARKFEPPAVTGGESQDAIETLMKIYRTTGDKKYLAPIPRALAYLKKSLLPDGRLARYYELKTNRPLYMTRDGDEYSLTYDDSMLPDHYGWKVNARLPAIASQTNDWRSELVSHDRFTRVKSDAWRKLKKQRASLAPSLRNCA